MKNIYDLSKTSENASPGKAPPKSNATLKKLIINKLDEEQIWQQLEIQNNFKNPEFLRLTSVILNANEKQNSITFPFKYQNEEEEAEESNEEEVDEEKEVEEETNAIESDDDVDVKEENEELSDDADNDEVGKFLAI